MSKLGIIIQARMESERLPGKVLMAMAGKPMIAHVVERARQVCPDVYLVCPPQDGELIQWAEQNNLTIVHDRIGRDVLDSYYLGASLHRLTDIVRLTGDNPLVDPDMVKGLIEFYFQGKYDWAANCRLKTTYQVGNDAEVFSFKALEKAWKSTTDKNDIEHVTPYIYNHPELFKLGVMESPMDLSHIRWTVDTQEDFDRVKAIIENRNVGGQNDGYQSKE